MKLSIHSQAVSLGPLAATATAALLAAYFIRRRKQSKRIQTFSSSLSHSIHSEQTPSRLFSLLAVALEVPLQSTPCEREASVSSSLSATGIVYATHSLSLSLWLSLTRAHTPTQFAWGHLVPQPIPRVCVRHPRDNLQLLVCDQFESDCAVDSAQRIVRVFLPMCR